MSAVLTERQQKCLEYAKQAQERGVSFAKFCRSHDLNLNTWYSIRLGLVRKGVIGGRREVVEAEAAKEVATATRDRRQLELPAHCLT
jgi:transposase-like protein